MTRRFYLTCLAGLFFVGAEAQDFVKGADIGFLAGQERRGILFRDTLNRERECLDLLRDYQINAVRLRVWVDPKDGECSKEEVLRMALRAKEKGMDIMINFHYGDWWADPSGQPIPAAWMGHSYRRMKRDLANHTIEVLSLLKAHGVTPRWVQVGNETSHGMLWSVKKDEATGWNYKDENGQTVITCSMAHIDHRPKRYAGFIRAGYNAVKRVFPEAIVIVHLDNGFDPALYDRNLGIVLKYGGRFDMIGMSLYPYWAMESGKEPTTEKTIADGMANIRRLFEKFGKEVMIVETGFQVDEAHPEVMEAGRRQLAQMIHDARHETNGHCRGVFYWEPQCLPGAYNLGAFDSHGRPTVIMNGFLEK